MERLFETESGTEATPRIFSLSEVALLLRDLFQQVFPGALWIKAEIAKMNVHQQSGHCYLDLVEKQLSQTKAQFRAVIWANDFDYVADKFLEVTRQELKGGMYVLILARPTFHPVYGLSLQIVDIEPSFTLGELERQKQATIGRLKSEGVFGMNKQLTFPTVPLRLAVISAATSKGYADFINIISNYPKRYRFNIQLFPALLQGDRAVESILAQLRNIEVQTSDFDLVLIIRGGGDEIGMTCFDNFSLAREVCMHPLPVVTGIGHSTNETVTEMVAARNKITPTDVAYDILGLMDAALNFLTATADAMGDVVSGLLAGQFDTLRLKGRQLSVLLHGRILQENIRLEQKSGWLRSLAGGIIRNHQTRLQLAGDTTKKRSRQLILERLDQLTGLGRQVALLDPVNVLKRGFSLTFRSDGMLVKSTADVEPGELILSHVSDGRIRSRVETHDS